MSRRMAPAVGELRAALANVPNRSTLLFLSYRVTPGCPRWPILDRTTPERHAAMMGSIPRELIVLNDYEPATGHFPVGYNDPQFAPIIDDFDFSRAKETAWKSALESANAGTFVVSWGVPSGNKNACEAWVDPPLLEPLKRLYVLRSEGVSNSRVQVWQRGKDAP